MTYHRHRLHTRALGIVLRPAIWSVQLGRTVHVITLGRRAYVQALVEKYGESMGLARGLR